MGLNLKVYLKKLCSLVNYVNKSNWDSTNLEQTNIKDKQNKQNKQLRVCDLMPNLT